MLLPAAFALLLASPLDAHPGHGADGGSHSLWHYLFASPHHWPWLALAAMALSLSFALSLRRVRARRGRA